MLTWSSLSLLIFYSVVAVGHEQKIQTVLVARWSPTSLLSEAAEFISDVDPYLFWQFVENVFTNQDSYPTPASDDAEADLASVSAFNVVSPAKLRLMEWAMTSRAYSPRVIMFTQMAPSQGPDCKSFVVFSNKKVACDVEQLRKIVEAGQLQGDVSSELFTEADHKYPSFVWSQQNPPVAVLYGQLTSPVTRKLHNYLITKVESIGYILRPYQEKTSEKMVLSGYGVELQFKSTEYVAQDDSSKTKDENQEVSGFVFNKLHEIYPSLSLELDKFQNHLASARGKKSEFEALKAWQVQELGLQASHFTTIQENFMDALLDVSGNFPSRAASLSSIRVPGDFKQAVAYNQRILQSSFNIDEGDGAFFLQGNYLDPDALDLFTFQDTMKSELNLMELLRSVYHEKALTRAKIDNILSLGSKTNSEPDLALDLRDSSVYWINDLEKDEEYEDWPDDLTQLFFRMGGVMLRPVRRNVFNLLLTLDPDEVSTAGEMLKLAQSFMAHKAPVRIGVVFCPTRESNTYGISNSDLIRRILNYAVAEEKMKKVFNDIVSAFTSNDFTKLKKTFGDPGEEFDFGAKMSCEFVKKSGRPTPGAFLNGVPLKWDTVDDFEEVVLSQLLREAQAIQIDAYNGRVRDDTDIFEYLMNKPNVQQRLNDKILDASNAKYISFGTEIWEPGKLPKNPMARLASSLKYLTPSGKRRTPVAVTMWIFSDVSSPEGQKFLLNAAEFLLDSSTHSRIAFIPTDNGDSAFKTMLLDAFAADDLKKVVEILKDYNNDLPGEGSLDDGVFDIAQTFMKLTGVPVGGKGVVVNGRLIGPLVNDELFDVGDWTLVEKFSFDSCAKHFDEEDSDADSIMRVCAALGDPVVKNRNAKRFQIPAFEKSFKVDSSRESDDFYVDLTVVIDPASRTAHKMASVLSAVRETIGQWLKVQIVFNPPAKHSELPLKSYYRYSAGERFNENIVFEDIPRDPLFTQNFYAPDNWMVEAVKGVDDLDNIRLRDLGSTVDSVYELEHLLIEGHCLESKTGSPPRGLQFTISSATTDENSNRDDKSTIVMANLGYFQLKAEPGVWNLGLREGPSKEIFSLETHNLKPVVVQSFQSVVVKVKVKRNPGKETTSLLDSEQESGGWFNFGSKKTDNEDDVLNIFSVASGHLYERVLKIMMLSVLKNTKSKVKFWFLKNYLSPTVKDILPEMAKEYGFEYELVQYHWPRWLNPQREKQRIIWGYKILFLDVLFPLSLKKIVFVDADQVVRTDLKELFELDLEGNPYGYTPFCDSRTEMEGFRFWKKGYWKSHLGKRKYHISALYVVDLVRFRRIAAGDRLRGQYQALSQDPNSLSNLDQDLPNNMIHQVGIKSLPQEWLWCETWCDSDSKKYAKTIDLCNNPLTKEPKLDAAQRIVPEWKGYDQELREFTMRVRGSGDSTTKDDSEKHTEL